MHIKTSIGNATRAIFLSSIMEQSGNYLPLTKREKRMIKWFIKFCFCVLLLVGSWIIPTKAIHGHLTHVRELEAQVATSTPKSFVEAQVSTNLTIPEARAETKEEAKAVSKTLRTVTAYNAGDPAQCDSTPCIGASGKDICKILASGGKVAAANFVPLGSKLRINGEVYTVEDRMNKRYPNRVDIAMRLDEKERAIKFGTQTLEVEIIK